MKNTLKNLTETEGSWKTEAVGRGLNKKKIKEPVSSKQIGMENREEIIRSVKWVMCLSFLRLGT